MHPASSVIIFTTLSGAGYGASIWLAVLVLLGVVSLQDNALLVGLAAGVVLVALGLLSSTLHLGHPERAWRALSQWRSSWLSREGIAALLSFGPMLYCAYAVYTATGTTPGIGATTGFVLLILIGAITVACTAMIYASLKSIARWHSPLVVPVYLLFSLLSGAVVLLPIFVLLSEVPREFAWAFVALMPLVWAVKWFYWRLTDARPIAGTIQSATGLQGEIRVFDPPHTHDNYLLSEMGHHVARKHAAKLRIIATLLGFVLPAVLLAVGITHGGAWLFFVSAIVTAAVAVAVVVERWLFFAEAEHAMSHYYGRQ